MFIDKPNRIIEIEKIIDKYFYDGDSDEKLTIVNKMMDKYKSELKNYKYVSKMTNLEIGQEIKYISRRNYKISGVTYITDIEKDVQGNILYIVGKTKMARVSKKISDLKSLIFIYYPDGNTPLKDLLKNMI